ncbi:MAG: hypothetical protein HQK91_02295 [Nitrospirae bacterium]|nr:hypothetical protein [Nitrospirota bacterium]MBF0540264.1 hypothetical protein [Nitrospirota bacterium]
MPKEHKTNYVNYFNEKYIEKKFKDNRDKFMLTNNPFSSSKTEALRLEIQKVKYSEVQFYKDWIAKDPSKRTKYIEETTKNAIISFPHSLCMHAVIITSDNKILLTKRSPKLDYYPNTWSISVKDQISYKAVSTNHLDTILSKWSELLFEKEVGLTKDDYFEKNLRILSVFLETDDILNCSLSAVFPIKLDENQFRDKLIHRTDFEFTEFTFLSYRELAKEILKPELSLHPTSGYRAILALIKHYGMPELLRILFK